MSPELANLMRLIDWQAPRILLCSSPSPVLVYYCACLLNSAIDPDLVPHSCAASPYPTRPFPRQSADLLIVPVLTMTVRSLLMYSLLTSRGRDCAGSFAHHLSFYLQTLSGKGHLVITFYRGTKIQSRFCGVGLVVDKCQVGNWVLLTK